MLSKIYFSKTILNKKNKNKIYIYIKLFLKICKKSFFKDFYVPQKEEEKRITKLFFRIQGGYLESSVRDGRTNDGRRLEILMTTIGCNIL